MDINDVMLEGMPSYIALMFREKDGLGDPRSFWLDSIGVYVVSPKAQCRLHMDSLGYVVWLIGTEE